MPPPRAGRRPEEDPWSIIAGVPAPTAGPGDVRVPTLGDLYARPSSDELAAMAGATGTATPPAAAPAPPPAPAEPDYEMSDEERAFLAEEPDPWDAIAAEEPAAPAPPAVDPEWAALVEAASPEARAREVAPTAEDLTRRLMESENRLEDVREALPAIEADARASVPTSPADMHRANRYAALLAAAGDDPVRRRAAYEAIYGETPEARFAAAGLAANDPTDPRAVSGAATLADAGVDLGPAAATPAAPTAPTAPAESAPGTRPRRGGGARGGAAGAPAAPPMSAEDALIALLTDRPYDAAALFPERRETALDRSLGIARDRATLDRRRAELAATSAADLGDRMAASDAARAANETNRREAMGAARERIRRATDAAREMRLDPEGYFNDRGAFGRIGAAILTGMGSFGAYLSGGTNEALGIINDAIDRDLEAQAQAIDSAWRGVDAESNLLDILDREFGSRDAAISQARAEMLDAVANRVTALAAGLDGTEAGINAREMRDNIIAQAQAAAAEAERAAFMAELEQRRALAETVSAEAEAMRDMRRAGGGGGPAYEAPSEATMNAANRALDSGASVDEVSRAYGIDPNLLRGGRFAETSAGDRADMIAALSTAVGRVEEVIEANPPYSPGVGIFDAPLSALTERGRMMRQRLRALAEAYGRLHSGGVISPAELENFESILYGSGTEAELREGIATARAEIEGRTVRDREGRTRDTVLGDATSAIGGTVVEGP